MAVAFECTTFVPLAAEAAFDLSLNIDAHVDSMADSGERVIAGVATGVVARGEFVTWQARHFGVNWTMPSEITEWDRPTAASMSRCTVRSSRSGTSTSSPLSITGPSFEIASGSRLHWVFW